MRNPEIVSGGDTALDVDKRLQNVITKLKLNADAAHIKEVSTFLATFLHFKSSIFHNVNFNRFAGAIIEKIIFMDDLHAS